MKNAERNALLLEVMSAISTSTSLPEALEIIASFKGLGGEDEEYVEPVSAPGVTEGEPAENLVDSPEDEYTVGEVEPEDEEAEEDEELTEDEEAVEEEFAEAEERYDHE